MQANVPSKIPTAWLLIPAAVGVVAWGAMAKLTHGGVDAPSFLMPLSIAMLLVTIVIELVAVPIGIRRLITGPYLRSLGNVLSVAVGGVYLLFQLLLMFV